MASDTRQKSDTTPTDSRATMQQSSQANPVRRRQASEGTSGPFGLMRQMQDEIGRASCRERV